MTPDRFKSKETVWITPEKVLDQVRKYFGGFIPLDPCTEKDNPTQAKVFFTKDDNGLSKDWGSLAFVNPPYGKEIRLWLKKVKEEAEKGCQIVLLVPITNRFEVSYWHDSIFIKEQNAECIVRKRVHFLRAVDDGLFDRTYEASNSNLYASIIYAFNVNKYRFFDSFGELGTCRAIDNN